MGLRVEEGKLSDNYNIFKDYNFKECYATNTRLMGVVAMRIVWESKTNVHDYLYQLIHLDYSEYGIDEYHEFTVAKNKESISLKSNLVDLWGKWETMSFCLGGEEKKIPIDEAIKFICSSMTNSLKYYNRRPIEIKKFQRYARKRINFMLLALDLPSFDKIELKSSEYILSLIPDNMSSYEVMNYFIMRLADRDFTAASILSEYSAKELRTLNLAGAGILSLMRNTLVSTTPVKYSASFEMTYNARSVLLGDNYYYAVSNIAIKKSGGNPRYKISSFQTNFISRISEFEAAMQLRSAEYITVYRSTVDIDEISSSEMLVMIKALPYKVPAGIVYMIYNNDNFHVNSRDYYLNQDVYGAVLFTLAGEIIAMSQHMTKIDMIEKHIMTSPASNKLELVDRYKFDNQIFQSFTQTRNIKFSEMLNDYE